MPRSFPPIEDHGLVGDLNSVALVAKDGTVDFMCAPRFDSPPVFASLLAGERGGCFELAPELEGARLRQQYLPDTNLLVTRFMASDGLGEITDFMPLGPPDTPRRLLRRAMAVRGSLRFSLRCAPRRGYALRPFQLRPLAQGVEFNAGPGEVALRLGSTHSLQLAEGEARARFTLAEGECAWFVLEAGEHLAAAGPLDPAGFAAELEQTGDFWRAWIGRSSYQGLWREEVRRSALVLKLLVSQAHGSLLAAPTFSLPEWIGGTRNWDYRYTWIRDAAFTLYALIRLGLSEETGSFIGWLAGITLQTGEAGPLQPVYRLDGDARLEEVVLGEWEGYRGSRPVRVGNAASGQLQLDIYGALLDSVYLYDRYARPIAHDFWLRLCQLVDWVCDNWQRPDRGIWEVRAEPRAYLNSRLMCWVAVDRALRLAQRRSLPAPMVRWLRVRDRIYRSIFSEMWNPRRNAFMQHAGGERMDASVLLMPLLRFIAPGDPRWLSTLAALREELVVDSMVRRYRIEQGATDGFAEHEGSFTMCSFWYAEALSRSGDLRQARLVFEKTLGYANHLGLFAEQLGPGGDHLGNFPQAFTHLALISAAYDLDRRLSGRPFPS
jgi:GH15 family glucan-1,4-alpha-glucosidase